MQSMQAGLTVERMAQDELLREVRRLPSREAAEFLEGRPIAQVVGVLAELNPAVVQDLLDEFAEERCAEILAAAPADVARQWSHNQAYAEDSVGRLMDPPVAVFPPTLSVGEAIEKLRDLVKTRFITYCYITDPAGKLLGLVTMRELLFADNERRLEEITLRDVFSLRPDMPLSEAMRLVVQRHFPVYPVCDGAGRLVGLVRGQAMFEERAFELSAQPGTMVGVEREERLATPWFRSLRLRHPWLQLNLLTAFVAGAVVGVFQETIDRLVILAMFLPVLAGQSGNTGCQALAVTLRGLTLGELKSGWGKMLVLKEALLGSMNGAMVGLVAALGMYVVATAQHSPSAVMLSAVVLLAMIGSCVISGVFGALVPMTLKRLGADPATASSIFLTTATDVASMGMLLGLATLLVR